MVFAVNYLTDFIFCLVTVNSHIKAKMKYAYEPTFSSIIVSFCERLLYGVGAKNGNGAFRKIP